MPAERPAHAAAREEQPLVSVVTPFYNTAPYLAECIESVLAQSYANWEYVLVNNCSTDGSLEIAERYARRDSRIRVLSNDQFVGQAENYNGALLRISPDSRYCKVVEADNWIFPTCLEAMVAFAEAHPSVGIVGSYYLQGSDVVGAHVVGAHLDDSSMDGRSACRMHLLDCLPLFGAPTNLLVRSSIVRGRMPFYDTGSLHCDREVCYFVLQNCDFGYVPQVLAFVRDRDGSNTSRLTELGTFHLYRLVLAQKCGRWLFPEQREYERYYQRIEREYSAALLKRLLTSRHRREVWRVHSQILARCGYRLSWRRLVREFPLELARRGLRAWSLSILPLLTGRSNATGRP